MIVRRQWALVFGLLAACNDGNATVGDSTSTSDPATTTTSTTTDADSSTVPGPQDTTSGEESSSSGPACAANLPPLSPVILEPLAGRIDVIPDALVIEVSPFADADAVGTGSVLQVEVWRERDGELDERAWTAELVGPTTVTLADGVFDPDYAEGLTEWDDFLVRARYADGSDACAAVGEWSELLAFRTDDGSTALFDESIVRDFYLEIGPASWNAIDAQAYPPGCVPYNRDYYAGTMRFEDQVFENVGIKIKGGCGSSRDLDGKASFKVNLEWDDPTALGCPEARRLMGEKSFSFHNGVQDNSASNERLGYALFRELGIPAPRAASVRLFVNDELWGLYTHVETIDRRFLERWFDSRHGALYEGTYWCDLEPSNVPMSLDDDSECLTREFTPDPCSEAEPDGDPLDYSRLQELVAQITALQDQDFYPAVDEFFEYDRFLTTWAIESAISHWDNYAFSIRNNYRVYHDPSTSRWTLISTGIDQTFSGDEDPWGVDGVIAEMCVEEPACEAAFAAKLAEVNDAFEGFGYAQRAEAIFDQLSPYVEEDPRREYGFNTFVSRHDEIQSYIAGRPDRIRQYLSSHGF